MWDRQTQSWLQQFDGQAIVGSLTGQRLTVLDSQTLSFSAFRAQHANGQVLSRDTGEVARIVVELRRRSHRVLMVRR